MMPSQDSATASTEVCVLGHALSRISHILHVPTETPMALNTFHGSQTHLALTHCAPAPTPRLSAWPTLLLLLVQTLTARDHHQDLPTSASHPSEDACFLVLPCCCLSSLSRMLKPSHSLVICLSTYIFDHFLMWHFR